MKQAIVVNDALKLPKGKLAAQVAHAAVAALLSANEATQRHWLAVGMPKVVLRGLDDEALLALEAKAATAGIAVALIRDAGHTVVPAGTITCVGIGPAPATDVDRLTGELKLL